MIEVLLFAGLQEKIGQSKIKIEADTITVKELIAEHLADYDADDLFASAMVAVNEEYAQADATLHAGDVVAFIPPVSGG